MLLSDNVPVLFCHCVFTVSFSLEGHGEKERNAVYIFFLVLSFLRFLSSNVHVHLLSLQEYLPPSFLFFHSVDRKRSKFLLVVKLDEPRVCTQRTFSMWYMRSCAHIRHKCYN